MRAGELRQRVTLEERTQVVASQGSLTSTWQGAETVWAAVEPVGGDEGERGKHADATVTHRVRIRYRPDVSPKMRLSHGDWTLEVVAVLNLDERNRELHLMCREVAG